jgi:hypothetical protein
MTILSRIGIIAGTTVIHSNFDSLEHSHRHRYRESYTVTVAWHWIPARLQDFIFQDITTLIPTFRARTLHN